MTVQLAHVAICHDIAHCAESLDWDALERLAARVLDHDRTFVLARGRSELALKMFAMRLTQMGRAIHVVGDVTTPAIARDDLLLVASASGETAGVCALAAKARSLGAAVGAFTGRANSSLGRVADPLVVVSAPSMLDIGRSQFGGSLFEQSLLLLCDAIVLSKLADDPGLAAKMSERHANLE